MPRRIAQAIIVLMGLYGTYAKAQGSRINLQEVELTEVALPVIKINEKEYSFRERDYFIRLLMKSKFWQQNFQLKMELTNFVNDSLFTYHMSGKTKVFVDGVELTKRHTFRRRKSINQLNQHLESLHICKNKQQQFIRIFTN